MPDRVKCLHALVAPRARGARAPTRWAPRRWPRPGGRWWDRGRCVAVTGKIRVAAIDCGTNSLRLLIADVDPAAGRLTELDRRMEIVRLGQGVDATGRLAPEALARTLAALAGYARLIRDAGRQGGPDGRHQRHPGRRQRRRVRPRGHRGARHGAGGAQRRGGGPAVLHRRDRGAARRPGRPRTWWWTSAAARRSSCWAARGEPDAAQRRLGRHRLRPADRAAPPLGPAGGGGDRGGRCRHRRGPGRGGRGGARGPGPRPWSAWPGR